MGLNGPKCSQGLDRTHLEPAGGLAPADSEWADLSVDATGIQSGNSRCCVRPEAWDLCEGVWAGAKGHHHNNSPSHEKALLSAL